MFTKKIFWVLVIGFWNLVSVDAKERSILSILIGREGKSCKKHRRFLDARFMKTSVEHVT